MDIVHLSVHRVTGLISLPDNADCELLHSPATRVRAWLTMNRETPFLHLKRCAAYDRMIAQMLVDKSTGPLAAPDRFAQALTATTILEGIRWDRPLLLIEACGTVDPVDGGRIDDMGTCGLGLRLFDPTTLVDAGKIALDAAIAGIALMLPPHTTPTVEALGTVGYAVESPSGRFLYSLESSASGSITPFTSIDAGRLGEIPSAVERLFKSADLRTVVHLLSRSLQTTDDLQAFLTAWAALEVFLDKAFKTYKPKIYTQLKAGVAAAAVPFVERLQKVIEEDARYNVRDKFVVVSSFLNSVDAGADLTMFVGLKKQRDGIHDMKSPAGGYRASATQGLLRKYLRLFLGMSPTTA